MSQFDIVFPDMAMIYPLLYRILRLAEQGREVQTLVIDEYQSTETNFSRDPGYLEQYLKPELLGAQNPMLSPFPMTIVGLKRPTWCEMRLAILKSMSP